MDDFFTIFIIANRFPIFRAIMFDAIIALKIGNRLAIIKIVKKIIHVLMLFNFFLYIYIFIIYKVMKYRKICIKYNAYFKKAVFHSRENIKSCIFTVVKI